MRTFLGLDDYRRIAVLAAVTLLAVGPQRTIAQTTQAPPKGAAPQHVVAPPTSAKGPTPAQSAAKPAPTKTPAPAPSKAPSTTQAKAAVHPVDSATKPIIIMREVYGYSPDGRRDPFVSLLTTSELRPTISDLRLTSISIDLTTPTGSLARVHDASSNKNYSIRINQLLGRMRVVAIRPNVVVFSVEELGMNRRDSLFLRPDTSNTRFE